MSVSKYLKFHNINYFTTGRVDEDVKTSSLKEFLKENLYKPELIKNLADEFMKMIIDFHRAKIFHLNLLPNIKIYQSETLKIKVYDVKNIYIPEIKSPEISINNFHPDLFPPYSNKYLSDAKSSLSLINLFYFSELVIYLSLCCLAKKPEYWDRFNLYNTDALIFTENDFNAPSSAIIFYELDNIDEKIKYLAAVLKDYCNENNIAKILPLENLINENEHADNKNIAKNISQPLKFELKNDHKEESDNLTLCNVNIDKKNKLINSIDQSKKIGPNEIHNYLTNFINLSLIAGLIIFLLWFTSRDSIYFKLIGNSMFISLASLGIIYSSNLTNTKSIFFSIKRDLYFFISFFIISFISYLVTNKFFDGFLYQTISFTIIGLIIFVFFKIHYNVDLPNKYILNIFLIIILSMLPCELFFHKLIFDIKLLFIYGGLISFIILMVSKQFIEINIAQVFYFILFLISGCFICIQTERAICSLTNYPLSQDVFFGFRSCVIMFMILFSVLIRKKISKDIVILKTDETVHEISLSSLKTVLYIFIAASSGIFFVMLMTLVEKNEILRYGYGTAIFHSFLYICIVLSFKNIFNIKSITKTEIFINTVLLSICCFCSASFIELLRIDLYNFFISFGFSLSILYGSIAFGLIMGRIIMLFTKKELKKKELLESFYILMIIMCGAFLGDIIRDYLKDSLKLVIMNQGGSAGIFFGFLFFSLLYSLNQTFLRINAAQVLYFSIFVFIGASLGENLKYFLINNWYIFIVQNGIGAGIFYASICFFTLLGLIIRRYLSEPIICTYRKC